MMKVIDHSWYVRPPGVRGRTSAGGVVCRVQNDVVLVALTIERRFFDACYILPKGGVKRGETLEQAAAREIEEEAGLTNLYLLGKLGVRARLGYGRTRWITTHYYLYRTEQASGLPTDPNHLYEVRWFPMSALPEMLWPEQRELIDGNRGTIEAAVRGTDRGKGISAPA